MSQYQMGTGGEQYPIDYNAGAYQSNPRPAAITVISIFAIIIGSLGLLCGGTTLALQAVMLGMHGRNPLMPNLPQMNDTTVTVYALVTGIVGLLIACAYLVAGIGGLKLWPAARRGMLWLAAFVFVWATANTIIQFAWLGPKTMQYSHRLQAQMGRPAPPPVFGNFEQAGQVVGTLVGWVAWCALPVCVMIFWRSPRVVSAFEAQGAAPPFAIGPTPTWLPPPGPPPGV